MGFFILFSSSSALANVDICNAHLVHANPKVTHIVRQFRVADLKEIVLGLSQNQKERKRLEEDLESIGFNIKKIETLQMENQKTSQILLERFDRFYDLVKLFENDLGEELMRQSLMSMVAFWGRYLKSRLEEGAVSHHWKMIVKLSSTFELKPNQKSLSKVTFYLFQQAVKRNMNLNDLLHCQAD